MFNRASFRPGLISVLENQSSLRTVRHNQDLCLKMPPQGGEVHFPEEALAGGFRFIAIVFQGRPAGQAKRFG